MKDMAEDPWARLTHQLGRGEGGAAVLDILAIALLLVMAACNVAAVHAHHKLWGRRP